MQYVQNLSLTFFSCFGFGFFFSDMYADILLAVTSLSVSFASALAATGVILEASARRFEVISSSRILSTARLRSGVTPSLLRPILSLMSSSARPFRSTPSTKWSRHCAGALPNAVYRACLFTRAKKWPPDSAAVCLHLRSCSMAVLWSVDALKNAATMSRMP